MTDCVIVCASLATGEPSHYDRQYLAAYDPDAHGGRGDVQWTSDIRNAMVFPHGAAAQATWSAVSVVRPRRSDGKLNRPLTAYSVVIATVAT